MRICLNNKIIPLMNGNKNIKIVHSFENTNTDTFVYDEDTIHQIFIRQYSTKQTTDTNIIIPFYFSDYYQREYAYNDYSLKFNLRYELDGVVYYINNLNAGEHEINLGKLTKGIHWYSLQVESLDGILSRRIFNDILVVDTAEYTITPEQTYVINSSDLYVYGIKNNNSTLVDDMKNTRYGLTQLLKHIKEQGFRKAVLPLGIYRVNRTPTNKADYTDSKDGCIEIPNELTLDLNGSTIKLHPYNDLEYGVIAKVDNTVVKMSDTFDSHLINGCLEGDFFERKTTGWLADSNGEFNIIFDAKGTEYCSLEDITIKQVTGYNTVCGASTNMIVYPFELTWLNDTTIVNGIETFKSLNSASTLTLIPKALKDSNYIVASVWLAVGLLRGKHWDIDFHFYDEFENFIETIKVYQFTRCRIPINAKYFRCSSRNEASAMQSITIHHMKSTRYFEFKNCNWIDNRTCSTQSQVQHLTYNNCTFTRSGNDITPCEIDFEDGWEQQQDIFIMNCEILENTGSADLIDCAGLNHVFENNKNFEFEIRYRPNGVTIKNNINCRVTNTIGGMTENTIRIYDNELSNISNSRLGDFEENYKTKKMIVKNNIISSSYLTTDKNSCVLYNNTIILDAWNGNYEIANSTIYVKGESAYITNNVYIHDSVFKVYSNQEDTKLSFNELNANRIYERVTFENKCRMVGHNLFNSGIWDSCIFNDISSIETNNTNKIGDIQFNNCTFKKNFSINTVQGCYIQFNNCNFMAGVTELEYANTMCTFNNCTGI